MTSDFLVKLTPTIAVMQSTLRADFAPLHEGRHWKAPIFASVDCTLDRAQYLAEVVGFFTGEVAQIITVGFDRRYILKGRGYWAVCGE